MWRLTTGLVLSSDHHQNTTFSPISTSVSKYISHMDQTKNTTPTAPAQAETKTEQPAKPSTSTTSKHTISAQLAAAGSTIMFYPLDSIKFRIMSQDGTKARVYHKGTNDFTGIISAMRGTYANEGVRALYRGVCLSIGGAVYSWGVYMFLYKYLMSLYYTDDTVARSVKVDYCASVTASLTCASVSNPIWLIKTRMQLQDRSAVGVTYYRHFFHGVRDVLRNEGVRALWKGLGPQMMLCVPNAAYLPLYEAIKHSILRERAKTDDRQLTLSEILFCTLIAKSAAAVVSNPLLVIKTKIQDHRNVQPNGGQTPYTSVRSVFRTAIAREGLWKGLILRGLTTSLVQTIPRSTAHILLYELFLRSF
ncbi:mitochondrial carrier protein [Perkinsela sp. CCAP 1560/4]|nr:mitochondrial carrier protein [Perkinsela sp. CCAP 1560/4]|eukprot:KNH04923.1 mitochondrial carrier protein [Perkinsela sp. CCAP 1560/4]